MLRKVLIACGILASLVWMGTDVLAALHYEGYNYPLDPISGLSATGAPTRSFVVPLDNLFVMLKIAFAWGIWLSTGQKRALRITAGLLFASGVVDLSASFFPWNPGEAVGTLANMIHAILAGGVPVLLILLTIGFGARAEGKWFRFYSYGILLVIIISGGLMAFLGDPRIDANQPPLWFGLTERIAAYGFMLWVMVLATVLLHTKPESSGHLVLLSPFAVIALGQLAAKIVGPLMDTWAWAYLFAGYWILLTGLILWGGGKEAISRWLQPSQGGPLWPVIAITFSFASTLWMFIPNWRLLLQPEILFPTFAFVLVNPCLEEGYWRGLIIDAATRWPGWLAILYSGGLSAINHLFVMVIVAAARNPAVWAYQLVLGLLMGVVYTKTKSLRWPIISHAIVNLLSLTVAMFLNVYVPGPPG